MRCWRIADIDSGLIERPQTEPILRIIGLTAYQLVDGKLVEIRQDGPCENDAQGAS